MSSLVNLTDALRCLPGVGPKSAQRMAHYLLQQKRDAGKHLAHCLQIAMDNVKNCTLCNNFTDNELCALCVDDTRKPNVLCIVENPADLSAIEQSNAYRGKYFVLMGKISPIDGLGPDEIGLPQLQNVVTENGVAELIIALSPSIEGQTTVHFIKELFKSHPIKISQLAHGIPSGGELEFLDGLTIGTAMKNRALID